MLPAILILTAILLLAACALAVVYWWVSPECDVVVIPRRPCICGHHVKPGEPFRWSPARDRMIHDWCIPVEASIGGEYVINAWLRQGDALAARSDKR